MHLTQLRFGRPVITDSSATHATVLSALDGTTGRVMWAAPRRDLLIVQAPTPVPAGRVDGVTDIHSGPIRTQWNIGDRVRLSLIANPVKSEYRPGIRGQRRPLPISDCGPWLTRRLAGAIDVDALAVDDLGTSTGRHRTGRITHRLVGYYGLGTVTGPDLLADLIVSGIGPGKAFGAGLLLVAAA